MKRTDEFTESDWSRLEQDWRAWWQGELERPLISIITGGDGAAQEPAGPELDASLAQFPLSMPADALLEQLEPALQRSRYWGDAYPQFVPNFGIAITAAALGAELRLLEGASWLMPLPLDSLEALTVRLDPDSGWWRRAQEITAAAAARWGARLAIGHTELGTSLDTLAYLRGEEPLYLDLAQSPRSASRLTAEITQIQLQMSAHVLQLCEGSGVGPGWLSGKGTLLSSFSSANVSPRMCQRYLLPDLEQRCQALAYPSFFLDGDRQRHILEMVLAIPGLSAVHYHPGSEEPPLEQWLPHLARIREAGKLCQLWASPETARGIIAALGGSGFMFHIVQPGRQLTADEAEAFLGSL